MNGDFVRPGLGHRTTPPGPQRNETALPLPDLGVSATVVVDQHNGEPRTVDDEIKDDWRDFGVGYLEDIPIISSWSAHVALYALQNPEPKTIARALELLWQSGDFDGWLEPEGDKIAFVQEPSGWREP